MASLRENHSAAFLARLPAALVTFALGCTLTACGGSSFAGKGSEPTPTPAPPPAEVKPLQNTQAATGSDIANISTVGGIESADKPGTPTGPSDIRVTTTASIPTAITTVTLLPSTQAPSLPPPSSRTGEPIPPLGAGTQGITVTNPCTANQMKIGNACVPVLLLHRWTSGSKEILSVVVTDACTQDSDAACQGLRMKGLGFSYAGLAGYAFPESAVNVVANAGLTSVRVVVCHKLQFGSEVSSSLHANPTAAEMKTFASKCPSGTESFLAASTSAAGFRSLVSLESGQTVGYVPSP